MHTLVLNINYPSPWWLKINIVIGPEGNTQVDSWSDVLFGQISSPLPKNDVKNTENKQILTVKKLHTENSCFKKNS